VSAVDELEAKARELHARFVTCPEWMRAIPEVKMMHVADLAAIRQALRSARAEGKREGLEEAAKVAEAPLAVLPEHPDIDHGGLVMATRRACTEIAKRIRALKDTNG
jgi:hypothetical protein